MRAPTRRFGARTRGSRSRAAGGHRVRLQVCPALKVGAGVAPRFPIAGCRAGQDQQNAEEQRLVVVVEGG